MFIKYHLLLIQLDHTKVHVCIKGKILAWLLAEGNNKAVVLNSWKITKKEYKNYKSTMYLNLYNANIRKEKT